MEFYQLESDRLSRALTKPLTQFGVPLMAFYLNGVLYFLAWTMLQIFFQQPLMLTIVLGALFCVTHLAMAWMTFRDPFGLSIFWMNITHFKQHTTFSWWNNTDSYAP
ncbi:MAG: Type secretory pathway, VirB3-like protein [Gammaproteobacteria bacterium]|jgi:type IV secretory pathway VirB3-like protein|nr:Type secretory pathway, VirB3-like protein [Gammaproteobacteria bacterium]